MKMPDSQLSRLLPRIASAVLAGALVSCTTGPMGPDGGEEDAGEHGEEPAEEACEHMAEGPDEDVTATADATGAPSVNTEHTRFDIALVDDGNGQYVGTVAYDADEEGDFLFFLDQDIPFALEEGGGASIEIEESASVAECTEVAIQHVAELAVGTAYLTFGPTDQTEVALVVEHAEHEDE